MFPKKQWVVIGIVLVLIGSLILDKCGFGIYRGVWGGMVEGFGPVRTDWRYDDMKQKNEDGTDMYPKCTKCNASYIGKTVGFEPDGVTKCAMPDPAKSTQYACGGANGDEFVFTCSSCNTSNIGKRFVGGASADPGSTQCLMPAYEDTPYTCDGSGSYVSIGPFRGLIAENGTTPNTYNNQTLISDTRFPHGTTIGGVKGYEQYPRCDVCTTTAHPTMGAGFGIDSKGETCVMPVVGMDGAYRCGEKGIFERIWTYFAGATEDVPVCAVCMDKHVGIVGEVTINGEQCRMPDHTLTGPYKCEDGKFAAADWIAGYNVDSNHTMLPRCTICKDGTAGDVLGNDTGRKGEMCSMPDTNIYGAGAAAIYRCEDGRFKFNQPIIRHGTYGTHETPYMSGGSANTEFNKMWAADETVASRNSWMANGDGVIGATEDQGATYASGGDQRTTATTAAQIIPLKFCSRCGHRLHGNKNYCSECGASTMSVQ
jgi:hypothetical protein